MGVHLLRGLITPVEAGRQYADLAEAVVAALWPVVTAEVARKHGPPPGRGAVVVAMGALGGGRLHARSDLDVIVIYDGAGVEASDGPRPLATRSYYARLTQALVTALTAPMGTGRLYEADLRLRPSGRQGPVATALGAFERYQREEAWTWEHLALTRARVVAGPADLAEDVEAVRGAVLAGQAGRAGIRTDVAEMRARLGAAKPGTGGLSVKEGPGRLTDVDLAAQMLALLSGGAERDTEAQIAAAEALGAVSVRGAEALRAAHRLGWAVQVVMQLVGVDLPLGEGATGLLMRATETEGLEDLQQRLDAGFAAAAEAIGAVLEDG